MKRIKKIQKFLKAWLGCDRGPTIGEMKGRKGFIVS